MKKELKWNVYVHTWNKGIESHNIFEHNGFYDKLYKLKKKYLKRSSFDFETFMKEVKSWMMYYYWSKFEWEISIDEPFLSEIKKSCRIKIDVYEQIRNNWDAFSEYLYNNYSHIRDPKKVEDK